VFKFTGLIKEAKEESKAGKGALIGAGVGVAESVREIHVANKRLNTPKGKAAIDTLRATNPKMWDSLVKGNKFTKKFKGLTLGMGAAMGAGIGGLIGSTMKKEAKKKGERTYDEHEYPGAGRIGKYVGTFQGTGTGAAAGAVLAAGGKEPSGIIGKMLGGKKYKVGFGKKMLAGGIAGAIGGGWLGGSIGERILGGPRLDKEASWFKGAKSSPTHLYHPGTSTGQKIKKEFTDMKIKINPNNPIVTDTTRHGGGNMNVVHRSVNPKGGNTQILTKKIRRSNSGFKVDSKAGTQTGNAKTLSHLANQRNNKNLVKHDIK
jgi:hypothetical protein